MKRRVAIIASHVIQYQDPLFRRLAADPEIDLTVFFCSRAGADSYVDRDMGTSVAWDLDLLHGYPHRFLRNFGFGRGYTRRINPAIVSSIGRGRFDAVILLLGWGTVTSLLALAACRATATPVFFFGDSTLPPAEVTLTARMRAAILRALFRHPDAFLVTGQRNAAYYRHYGASEARFFPVPYAVDNERFALGSRGTRDAGRATLGVREDDLVIVFSGKLVARKDPMTLVHAVSRMSHRDRTTILFLGDGELKGRIASEAARLGVHAVFRGFVNQTALPREYATGDVLVLPSTYEPLGLVLNEAMASGLPVLASDQVGAASDLIRSGENGWTFPAGDADVLAGHLDRLASAPELRATMAKASRRIIASWDYDAAIRGVKQALAARC